MGPKKKGKGKKAKSKKKEDTPVQEKSEYDGMDLDMLREVTPMLRQQLEKTQMDRNYVQLERDTIQQFYDITKEEVEDLELAIKTKDRKMEILEENHRTEVRVYIQKVKHLEYEHKNNVKLVGQDGEFRLDEEKDSHSNREQMLKTAKTSLKLELKERELSNEDEIEQMKQAHEKNLSKLREEFEKNVMELRNRCENRLQQLLEDLELRRKVDIHEIEERKNLHINDLMKNHEKAFTQIKNYYNDITYDNLKLIKSLKDEIKQMKKKATANSKLMHDISQENKRLSEPLAAAVQEVSRLKHELKDEEKDKLSLKNAKSRLVLIEKQLNALRYTHKDFDEEFSRVESERDQIYNSFEQTIHTVQRKSEIKNMVLEQRLTYMNELLEKKQAQFDEILQAANMDPAEASRIMNKLNEVLLTKNKAIHDVQYRVSKSSKAFNDTLNTLKDKLQELGIPQDEFEAMGFKLLITSTSTGPAGLVAR